MRKSISSFSFEDVWHNKSPALKREIIAFWEVEGVLTDEERMRRVDEVVFVARYEGKVVGLSTVFRYYLEQLENHLYVYRCLISEDYRGPAVDTQLILHTRNMLELYEKTAQAPKCIGLLMVIQNEYIKKEWRWAVWAGTDMMYIGETSKGDHLRVYYFDGARI
ncbi:MAG: GNAT family N-acetyltransferase [Bacteroidota bacterium]